MNATLKQIAVGVGCLLASSITVESGSPPRFDFIPAARAIVGAAPGGSMARRHAIAATSANANAAAAANANAAAANANAQAAAANAQAAAAGPPPVGTVVTSLPPGCETTMLNGVEYQRCGATYYRATMQGSNLVYVVRQP